MDTHGPTWMEDCDGLNEMVLNGWGWIRIKSLLLYACTDSSRFPVVPCGWFPAA